ncbi:MAG: hypothetical protein ABF377_04330 [Akkermansiaceae bacterium]
MKLKPATIIHRRLLFPLHPVWERIRRAPKQPIVKASINADEGAGTRA